MSSVDPKMPLGVRILAWYGIIFGFSYILVSVVSIVLSIMDRTYKDIGQNFIIGLYGIPIIAAGFGFKGGQKWGWFGYSIFLIIVVLWSVLAYRDFYGILVGLLSLIVLAGIMTPAVRRHFFVV
jgi:hypothetical protein